MQPGNTDATVGGMGQDNPHLEASYKERLESAAPQERPVTVGEALACFGPDDRVHSDKRFGAAQYLRDD